MMCRKTGMTTRVQIFGNKHPQNSREQKTCKNQHDFGQLQTLTANIFETESTIGISSDKLQPSCAERKKLMNSEKKLQGRLPKINNVLAAY